MTEQNLRFTKKFNTHCFNFVLTIIIAFISSSAEAESVTQEPISYGRISIQEENDHFASHDDRHYTQGLRLSYLSSSVSHDGFWDQPFGMLSDNLPIFQGSNRLRKYDWTIVGQSIFTPTNILRTIPSLKDRPYAAWLYTGASLLQETKHEDYHTLENAELLMGVVGAAALGGVTQNDFHQFINVPNALGWNNQLRNEPGLILSYERKWRFEAPILNNFAVDIIPELGASGGNILTYGEAGGMVRMGQNLTADYGPDRIRPSLSGLGWFDASQLNGSIGWYLFAGAQERVIGHNIFLDGNTFTHSAYVDTKPMVTDFMGGVSLLFSSDMRADFTVTQRSKEFYGQAGHPDRFGGINLTLEL